MRLASYTAAAILAFTFAQAGAVPSPQADNNAIHPEPVPPPQEPVYYPDETNDGEVEKRDDKKKDEIKIDGIARKFGGHNWENLGDQRNHGPMPDDNDHRDGDRIDLTPYLTHTDPVVAAMATSIARRAPAPKEIQVDGIWVISAPTYHWWEQQGPKDGSGLTPTVGGNPNIMPYWNWKEMDRWGKGFKKRDADGNDQHGPEGFNKEWMGGRDQDKGDHGGQGHDQHHEGPPADDGGAGKGEHKDGPPADKGKGEHGQGGHQGAPRSDKSNTKAAPHDGKSPSGHHPHPTATGHSGPSHHKGGPPTASKVPENGGSGGHGQSQHQGAPRSDGSKGQGQGNPPKEKELGDKGAHKDPPPAGATNGQGASGNHKNGPPKGMGQNHGRPSAGKIPGGNGQQKGGPPDGKGKGQGGDKGNGKQ